MRDRLQKKLGAPPGNFCNAKIHKDTFCESSPDKAALQSRPTPMKGNRRSRSFFPFIHTSPKTTKPAKHSSIRPGVMMPSFAPKALADIAKSIYTRCSVIDGNYKAVAKSNGKTIGLLFDRNEHRPTPRGKFAFSLMIIWRLIRVKNCQ